MVYTYSEAAIFPPVCSSAFCVAEDISAPYACCNTPNLQSAKPSDTNEGQRGCGPSDTSLVFYSPRRRLCAFCPSKMISCPLAGVARRGVKVSQPCIRMRGACVIHASVSPCTKASRHARGKSLCWWEQSTHSNGKESSLRMD